MRAWLFVLVCISGCANSSVIPIAQDTVQITTAAAPICGPTGAQKVASSRAAIETIRRGYDRYVIIGGQYQNDVRVVGHTPVQAQTYGTATATGYGNYAVASGSSTTTYSGGQPIMGGSHNQGLMVKMFKEGDPGAANALSARDILGPKWQEAVTNNNFTCF